MNDKFNTTRDLILSNPLLIETKIGFKEIKLIVEKIEKILADFQINDLIKNKIYFASVELLQNTLRYGKQEEDINFVINKSLGKLYILSENHIYNDEVQKVKEKLDKINSLKSYEELKSYYKSIIIEGRLGVGVGGGAGIGFIDIRRKTDEALLYNFKDADNNMKLFSIIATINVDF